MSAMLLGVEVTVMLLFLWPFVTWNINYKEKYSFALPLGVCLGKGHGHSSVALGVCGSISLLTCAFTQPLPKGTNTSCR